jgi:hypothetical protein
MKSALILICFLVQIQLSAQQTSVFNLDVKEFGALGNGIKDDYSAINSAIEFAKNNIRTDQNKVGKVTLYFPPGTYKLSKALRIPKMVDLVGEKNHQSVIKVDNLNSEAIIITNSDMDKKHKVVDYNVIKDIVILGPDKASDPFVWKDIKRNNPSSVGIRVEGVRNRIENCVIDGFLWAGIEISNSYGNYITNSFIKNNRVGVVISNVSTTTYINNNEIRLNAIGIHIRNRSYSNFINNNLIEANISNYLEADKVMSAGKIVSKGKGLLIENSMMNYVNNNFFEQHFVSVSISNSYQNYINDNFIAVGSTMPHDLKNQIILQFSNGSSSNNISHNNVMTSNKKLDPFIILFDNANTDYSTNLIDFGQEFNQKIRNQVKKDTFSTNENNMPQIP